jgi:hypothetical protein
VNEPFEFDQAIADEICDRLAKGESLRTICSSERDDFMPGRTTVFRWLQENADFANQYAGAREAQADAKFDQAWEIASAATADSVQVARLQVDTVKWQAAKLAPKKYGEKVSHEHGGEGGGAIKTQVTVEFVNPAS